jgi:uncharacterized protein
MRAALIIFAAIATITLGAAPVAAQNVNCRNPSGPTDYQVCRYPHLGELEDRVARRYFRLRGELRGRAVYDLENDHLRFRRARRDCVDNVRCIEAAYQRRLDELREYRPRRY